MTFGYDEARPTKEQYDRFVENFSQRLEKSNINGLSLMIYGSYLRPKDFNPGRSDIDAVLIFPGGVEINKQDLSEVGKMLANVLEPQRIPFQVTTTDLKTMIDGRFNSYNPSFKDYFTNEGKVIVGPDYRLSFNYNPMKFSDHSSLVFNLRKSRQGLLFASYDREKDYSKFIQRFNKSLDAVTRGSKQVLSLIDKKVRSTRFSAIDEIGNIFPEVNFEQLEILSRLYKNPELLDEIYRNPNEVQKTWENSLTFLEQLIDAYIVEFES
ncbi:hypothetical protein HOA92_02975 [archaeon]|jgi:hypothetical protein|nr:hypothetical protein [archaeon]MBT6761978.1 hypothetical protein [archaeon]